MDGVGIKQRYWDIVRQAKSSRIKHAYNALIEIRKKYLKNHGDTGIDYLIGAGLIGRLVELIRTRGNLDSDYKNKVLDLTLSILANMCMQEKIRSQVLKTDVVQELGELFEETDIESLLNRSCRCLANILLSPKSWEPVHELNILEKLAELLNKTEDDDCKQTFIRAVRLLGQTPKYVGSLVDYCLVPAVLKYIDTENQDVAAVSLRCVISLANHGCTPKFAQQVGKSGKLEYMMGLLDSSNKEVLHLICQLSAHVEFRPYFGNAGGIIKFIENFQSTELPYTEWRIESLNILCLCCQESVNRVKLRENGALKMFIESISNPEFKVLHERIISALVCFQYDEQSFNILIDLGMVQLLCKLLRGHIDKSTEELNKLIDKESKTHSDKKPGEDTSIIDKSENSLGKEKEPGLKHQFDCQISQSDAKKDGISLSLLGNTVKSSHKCEDFAVLSNEGKAKQSSGEEIKNAKAGAKCMNSFLEDRSTDENNKNQSSSNETTTDDVFNLNERQADKNADDVNTDEKNANDKQAENTKSQRPKYSINSPTYESVAQKLDESYHSGAKCIESFTPPYNQYGNTSSPYSPLSNSSYYSPSGSSPEYPENSPTSSSSSADRGRGTTRNIRFSSNDSTHSPGAPKPKYTGFTWSPDSSPDRSSTSPPGLKKFDLPKASPPFSPKTDSTHGPESASRCSETDSIFDNAEYQFSPVISSIDFNEMILENVNNTYSHNDTIKTKNEEFTNRSKNSTSDANSECVTYAEPKFKEEQSYDTKPIHSKKFLFSEIFTEDSSAKISEDKTFDSKKLDIKREKTKTVRRKRKRPSDHSAVFEYNILILLSHVQVINASLHIATEQMLTCLLDYISMIETPQAKSARILSQTFRDRHCFEKLIRLKLPMLIINKLLQGHEYSDLVLNNKTDKRQDLQSRRSSGITDCSLAESDRFCVVNDEDDDDLEPNQPRKRYKVSQSVDEQPLNKTSKDQNNMDICSRERSAVAFLDDLASVADTGFGRGVIERVLITCDKDQYINICMGIPFIIRVDDSKQFYFKQLNVLDKLLEELDKTDFTESHSKNIGTILEGFSYLAKVSRIDHKYCKSFFNQISNNKEPNMLNNACKMNDADSVITDTIVFIVEGGRIVVSRSVVMEKSEILCAMLRGGYKESNLHEIPLPETSYTAFRYIIHYINGCGKSCEAINYLHQTEPNRASAKHCTDLLTEADKHLLLNLKDHLISNLVGRFLVPDCAYPVFEYAVINENIHLQKAVVTNLLVHAPLDHLYDLGLEFLQSRYKDSFLHTIVDILTE